ncbi:hypothetical protein CQR48_0021 [Bifidobacterium thermophilum]|uniref:hypothetical protein n=1 Tax=Bifidobacterium thermophilum TaxID=33905 RepID=UPI000CC97EDD|nr:hypothetical protein [Bifidobacterium thermophilum]PKU91956.1 hypothetical protein CQR48_0021 [Bifidobacterium thermophilum]
MTDDGKALPIDSGTSAASEALGMPKTTGNEIARSRQATEKASSTSGEDAFRRNNDSFNADDDYADDDPWQDPLHPWNGLYDRAQASPQPDDDVMAKLQREADGSSLSPQASAAYAVGMSPVERQEATAGSAQQSVHSEQTQAGAATAAGAGSDSGERSNLRNNPADSDRDSDNHPGHAGEPAVHEHEFHAGEGRDPHALAAPKLKRQRKPISAERWIAGGAALSALLSLAAASCAALRAVAPGKLSQLAVLPVSAYTAIGCVFAVLAIILVVAARVADLKRRKGGHAGTAAIVLTAMAGVLIASALVVGNFFPDGIIKASGRDNAPVNSTSRMESGIEEATERCSDGWQTMDVSGYPGISTVAVCKTTRMAFVTFDSASAASMYRSAITSKISSTLDSYSTDSRAQGEWRILSGERWIAFGQKSDIEALHDQWGGTISTVQ